MIDRCANPQCSKTLHYLREGKIYLFAAHPEITKASTGCQREHYWLCGDCSRVFTMKQQMNEAPALIPLSREGFCREESCVGERVR
jgi:hypothetical protein